MSIFLRILLAELMQALVRQTLLLLLLLLFAFEYKTLRAIIAAKSVKIINNKAPIKNVLLAFFFSC